MAGNFIFIQYEFSRLPKPVINQYTSVNQIPAASILPSAIPSPSGSPASSVTKTQIIYQQAPSQTQITYIPLSGGNTQNTDWTNVSGTQFNLNISDYGAKAYAVWDANLRVNNANGTTYARIFDITHSIAVNGSEINISNTSSSTDVISSSSSFWQGNNTYIVQLKSLNGSTAFMDSGRIKITY